MTVTAPRSRMTAEELFDLPDDGGRSELVEGELVPRTPTGGRHAALAVRIGRLLDEHVEARDLGVCCGPGTGFILQRNPDTVRAPDAAVVLKARIPDTGIPTAYWPFAPDHAVEVVSPSDRLADVHVKIAEYFAAGTRLVWLVEPETRMVHVYRYTHLLELAQQEEDGWRTVAKYIDRVRNMGTTQWARFRDRIEQAEVEAAFARFLRIEPPRIQPFRDSLVETMPDLPHEPITEKLK